MAVLTTTKVFQAALGKDMSARPTELFKGSRSSIFGTLTFCWCCSLTLELIKFLVPLE